MVQLVTFVQLVPFVVPVQQHDAGGVHRGRSALVPRDPVGRAARAAHAAGALAAAQAGVDAAAQAGERGREGGTNYDTEKAKDSDRDNNMA